MMAAVTVRHLSQRFGRMVALDRVGFDLHRGITGLLGPNGAGKTTLLRALATVHAPDAGSISVFGLDPDEPAQRTQIRHRLGYLPQDPGFYSNFRCADFLDYLAILKEIVDTRTRRAEVQRVLDLVGLSDRAASRIRTLSGGMRRRLGLAQALLGSPDLLLLDEPTVGLDPEQRFRFRELFSTLGEERVVLLSTHQTEDVAAICDRVLVMDAGCLLWQGTPAALAEVARGRVWSVPTRPDGAQPFWRTADGRFRGVGEPPPGATLIEPAIEDGYLLLVGHAALAARDTAAIA